MDTQALLSSIRAGEDTGLELKEIVFRGDRIAFGTDTGRDASKLAEVFVSMANTRGGRRPELEEIGQATKLTIFAARHEP